MSKNNTNELIIEIFSQLGLDIEMGIVYDYFLKNPRSNITDCSFFTKISRQKIYKHIENLEENNLIIKNNSQNSKNISVQSPSFLLGLTRAKNAKLTTLENKLKENLIWLNTIFENNSQNKVIDFKKNRNEFISYFIDKYSSSKKPILFYGSTNEILEFIDPNTVNLAISLRLQNRTHHQVIAFDKLMENVDNEKIRRSVKYIQKPEKYSSSYNVFDDSVVIWNVSAPTLLIIRDIATVNMMRGQFNLLWENLP